MDENAFLESVRKTGRPCWSRGPSTCGWGLEIIAGSTRKLSFPSGPVVRVTGSTYVPLMKLENHYLPNTEADPEGMKKVMTFLIKAIGNSGIARKNLYSMLYAPCSMLFP